MAEEEGALRGEYRYSMRIPTRFVDNEELGHVNNAVYYTYFEAIVVKFDMEELGLDWQETPVIPYVVESLCRFRRALSFPETVEAGLRITHLGNSSVKYSVGMFSEGVEEPAAEGYLVQVYVDRETERPTAIPAEFRTVYEMWG